VVDTEVHGRIGSRTRSELTAEALRAQGIEPKHEIRISKLETNSNVQKDKKFKTTSYWIRSFGFSGFGIYFGPRLFRSAGPLSIFGFGFKVSEELAIDP
jgi:hypothetical protein